MAATACTAPTGDVVPTQPPDPPRCESGPTSPPGFCETALPAGIDLVRIAAPENVPPARAAIADFDGDGDLDAYLAGAALPGRYYENDGAGAFRDATDDAGLSAVSEVTGVGVADLDGDFDLDLVLGGKRRGVRLYENIGAGRFSLVSPPRGFGSRAADAASIAIGDIDGDRDLDVFVATWGSADDVDISDPELLFRNDGALRFVDVADSAGASGGASAMALAAALFDIEGDGDTDLYVANDFGMLHAPNFDLRNDGSGAFDAVSVGGDVAVFGMSVSPADYDADGDLDIYIANIGDNVLLRNDGSGQLVDVARPTGVAAYGYLDDREPYRNYPPFDPQSADSFLRQYADWAADYLHPEERVHTVTSWSTLWFDFDHDGVLDLYVCNAFVGTGVAPEGRRQPNMLFRGNADGTFDDVTNDRGAGDRGDSFACAAGDVDGDGDLDLLIANSGWNDDVEGGRIALLRNDAAIGRWLMVRLRDETSLNTEGIGAVIRIESGGRMQWRHVSGGDGFAAVSQRTVHFGLGDAERVSSVTVTWPDGTNQTLDDVATNQVLVVERR